LNDMPGTQFNSQLQPGKLPNSTDIFINALPSQPVVGSTTVDNFGSRYTGRQRATATLIWNNPFRVGDTLTASLLSSGALLNYQRVAYAWPIADAGLQLGLSAADMNYRLGDGAESLRAHGRLGQQAVWLDYPWVRNSQYQLKSRVQLEYMDPRDHQDASNIKTDRQLRILSLSANQENTDAFMAGGLSQLYAELTHGHTDFTNQVAAANDEVTARTAGRFTKVNLRGYRNQAINPLFSLSLSMDGQWAQKNLDATQKFSLGGLRSVRAYEAGALSADTGIFSSVELRMLLPPPDDNWNIQGQWYASVFWDKAVARVNKNPWSNTSNLAHLRGTGLAMYWQGPNEWRATVSVGKSLGSVSSLLSSSDAIHKTAWLELAKAWR
jgi:hemolysin activation/secretion protein